MKKIIIAVFVMLSLVLSACASTVPEILDADQIQEKAVAAAALKEEVATAKTLSKSVKTQENDVVKVTRLSTKFVDYDKSYNLYEGLSDRATIVVYLLEIDDNGADWVRNIWCEPELSVSFNGPGLIHREDGEACYTCDKYTTYPRSEMSLYVVRFPGEINVDDVTIKVESGSNVAFEVKAEEGSFEDLSPAFRVYKINGEYYALDKMKRYGEHSLWFEFHPCGGAYEPFQPECFEIYDDGSISIAHKFTLESAPDRYIGHNGGETILIMSCLPDWDFDLDADDPEFNDMFDKWHAEEEAIFNMLLEGDIGIHAVADDSDDLYITEARIGVPGREIDEETFRSYHVFSEGRGAY